MDKIILEYLKASLDEQSPVTVYFDSNQLHGVVSAFYGAVVELRQEQRRTVVLTERITAVTRE